MESENHPFEKENHLPNLHFGVPYNPMESKTIHDYVFKAPNLILTESTHQNIHICLQKTAS